MAGFFDALADAELFLLGVPVDRAETPPDAEIGAGSDDAQAQPQFSDAHYRSALG